MINGAQYKNKKLLIPSKRRFYKYVFVIYVSIQLILLPDNDI